MSIILEKITILDSHLEYLFNLKVFTTKPQKLKGQFISDFNFFSTLKKLRPDPVVGLGVVCEFASSFLFILFVNQTDTVRG